MPANNHRNPGCLGIIFPFLRPARQAADNENLPYRLRDDFLSPAEFSFFMVLRSAMGAEYSVQAKVRLADLFFVPRSQSRRQAFLNKIIHRHLDFLVCEARTMKPVLGIELDDSSHEREDRQQRDEFTSQVFQKAGLPLLRFPAQRAYVTDELAAQIAPLLKTNPVNPSSPTQEEAIPLCPKCGSPMVLRTATQGEHKGQQFYGCSNFPQCREVRSIS